MTSRLLWGVVVVCAAAVLTPRAEAGNSSFAQREQFTRAYKAFLANDVARGTALSAGLDDYVLYPRLRYESLRRRLDKGDIDALQAEVRRFIEANGHSHVGELIRTQWLASLAERQRWRDFLTDYAPQESIGLQCAHFNARIAVGTPADNPGNLEREARELWMTGASLPPECNAVGAWLARAGLLSSEQRWERMRLAMAKGNTSLVAQLGARLAPADRRYVEIWRNVYKDPAKFLSSPELSQDSPQARTIVHTGIERLARQNAGKAYDEWLRHRERHAFGDSEAGEIAMAIGLAAVRQDRADAIQKLDVVPDNYAHADLQRAQLLAALQARNWERIASWTEQPPAEGMNASRWHYWRARALEFQGRTTEARQIYLELSAERDYYGLMSAEHLDVPYSFAHQPLSVTAQAVQNFLAQPGTQRVKELRLLGFEATARQEWSFELGRLDRTGMIEAAASAHSLGWHDVAIAALGKAKEYNDLDIRYPLAFGEVVREYARVRNLEPAVMLSVIRQESAFNETARSPAGALGLMQVMPATGRQTAKKLGAGFSTGDLLSAPRNVMIGSAYLREMLDRFGGNLAMAAAAYNAGPHRVEVWRPRRDCIEADIWVDTIPFTETRRYVRNILFITALYQMRLQQEIMPLHERVTVVHAETASMSHCKTTLEASKIVAKDSGEES